MHIALPLKLTQQLLQHAQSTPNQEVCGIISQQYDSVFHCYPIDNVAEQPEKYFLFDEKQHIAAVVTMREQGQSLFAIYHSHPTAAALPSSTDIAMSNDSNAVYLIISLNTKGVLELRGFKIVAEQVQELTLTLFS